MSKSESFHDIEFIAVEYPNKQQIKEAYEQLLKAALPDDVSSVPIISHLNAGGPSSRFQEPQHGTEASLGQAANKWMLQLQCLLEVSGTVVDLIDIQSASVAVCLEDGWDSTSQVCLLLLLFHAGPLYLTSLSVNVTKVGGNHCIVIIALLSLSWILQYVPVAVW